MFHQSTFDACKGKWRGVLLELGLPDNVLKDKHGPCPLCGGVDRFRFDNKEGKGTWICGQCGAGTGMDLAMAYTGQDFRDIAPRIDQIIGNVKMDADKPRPQMSDADRRNALRQVYASSRPMQPGDLADTYLRSRGLDETTYPDCLRFADRLSDGSGGVRPAMVATVVDGEGVPVSLHRTFLRPDGMAKAETSAPRKMMPGVLPDGACVRVQGWSSGCLGIAEGIETAMAAGHLYEVPTWAALTSKMLERWTPPEGCEEVAIFGDNDPKFGGQSAAYRLAHKLAVKGLTVTVHMPPITGEDWADVWLNRVQADKASQIIQEVLGR